MNQVTSFQKRIMWRLTAVVVAAFVLFGAVMIMVLSNQFRADLRQETTRSLETLAELANREIFDLTNELGRISTSSTLLEYARVISTVPNTAVVLTNPTNIQRDTLRAFDDLIRRGGDRFISVRYVSRDGQVWAQATARDTEVLVTPVGESVLLGSPGLAAALTEGRAGQPFFSAVVADEVEGTSLLYLYVPVATLGNASNILGTTQMIIRLDTIETFFVNLLENPLVQQSGRRILLLDSQNRVLVDSGLGGSLSAPLLESLTENTGAFDPTPLAGQVLSTRLLDAYGGENTPWRLVMVDSQNILAQSRMGVALGLLALMALTLGGVVFALNTLTRRMTRPLTLASASASRLAAITPEDTLRGNRASDEVDVLALSVERINTRVENLRQELSEQVKRRSRDLELAARIGREVATLYDIDTLLSHSINLIADELGFYHAQVFLLDDAGMNAVLAHSRGKAGEKLLEYGFQIPVGSNTVIGRVTATAQPVIVNDTEKRGATHGFNPLLPETRAEIGLPLISKNKVIGVLDIQSKTPDSFLDEDLPTYQLLADQLAIAIENARLISQTDKRIQQIDTLNRQLTREMWDEAAQDAGFNKSFQYNLLDVVETEPSTNGSDTPFGIDINIRGQVIGRIAAQAEAGYDFTDGDSVIMQAVANRVALAIENARLFRETQDTLTETETLYQLSRYLNEANTLEDILQAISISVMRDASSGQVWMFDEYERGDAPDWMTLQADLMRGEREEGNRSLGALRLRMTDHPFLYNLPNDTVTLLGNIRTDDRLDSGLKLIFRRLGTEAVVVIPLMVRGQWRGIITMGFNKARNFSEREGRIYGALSDQAGVAIDNRLLLQQTELEVQRNENLYAASRIINTADNMQDLVYAAVNTSNDPNLQYALSLLESPMDTSGWPTRARMVARSSERGMAVQELDDLYDFEVDVDSPMRHREPEIIRDDMPTNPNVSPRVAWIRSLGYRFMAIFPLFSANQPIALFHVASQDLREMPTADYEVIRALTGQMSSQIQIRKLLEITQSEQRYLRSVLETLPTGVLVLDPYTLIPVQYNQQALDLLGEDIDFDMPFSVESYRLYRADTNTPYPEDDLPIFVALDKGHMASADDIAVMLDDTTNVEVLMNAAPITDENGRVTSIVVALQDITSLKQLERTLNENLRETVSLYETQRQLTAASGFDEVLNVVMMNLMMMQQPIEVYILLTDLSERVSVARSMTVTPDDPEVLRALLDTKEAVIINDVPESDLPLEAKVLFQRLQAYSVISLPINVSSRDYPVGWLIVAYEMENSVSFTEQRVLNQLRDATATALDNRLLIESQEASLREVQNLYSATNAIARSRNISNLTDVLRDSLLTLNPDYVFAYVREGENLFGSEMTMIDLLPEDAPALDFKSVMMDYDIPPGGVYINDLNQVIDHVPTESQMLAVGIQAFAAINLRLRDSENGFIVIAYNRPHNFTDTEDRYLNTLADGAGVLLNNFVLFNETQNALEEMSTLYQSSRALYDAVSEQNVLEVAVNDLVSTHINMVQLVLLETPEWTQENATARIRASWTVEDDLDLTVININRSTSPFWDLMASEFVTTVDDAETDERLSEEERIMMDALGVRSAVIIPLRVPNRIIGAMILASDEAHNYFVREQRTYQSFGEQASLTLEASYLLQQTERRARQLQTSAEVSQSVAQLLDLDLLFPRLVDLIRDAFAYDHAQIFLMDEEDRFAELRASTGEPGRKLLERRHKLEKGSESVIGQVTATGQPYLALDTMSGASIHRPNPYLPDTRSEMALPLIIKGRVVGALDVQSWQPNAFVEEDIETLTTLAAQISVAIDNANLYDAAQQQAGQMQFLFEITSAAAAADTLQETLERVANDIRSTFGSSSVVVYLPRTYVDETGRDKTPITLLEPVTVAGSDQPLTEIEAVNLKDETKLLAEIARTKRSFVIEDMQAQKSYLPVIADSRSGMVLPLTIGGNLIGLIVLEDKRSSVYQYETIQILLTLAGSLSAIVQSTQLLEQLQSTNEQLRELDRLKSDFLANMSHELRTPLNSIIGFSRVMLKGIDGPLTEMQEQDLTTIYNSGQHLLMLINDVLDQAKIAAEKLDLKFAFFEIKPLVEGVKAIGIGLVKDKPIDLRVELAPNMPKVYGDEFRTRQVLLNLVSNASKFTHEGQITISAYPIEMSDGALMVRIDVQDTGIGIADKDLPLLFEAFRQVDSSLTRTAGGTGLGLPIAKSLTEMQGGEMLVQSETNLGSVFSITIPTQPPATEPTDDAVIDETGLDVSTNIPTLQDKPDTQPARRTNTVEAAAMPPGSRKVKQNRREVLLIEDNKDMVDQFRRALQREGFEVQTADHPAYAEAMVSNLRPTLLVMDVNFGNGEGWNILQRLKDRDDTFDIPVVVVTLSAESERAYQLGAHSFIQRPFDPEQLVQAALQAEQESNVERILIIDDEPDAVRLLTQLLNENGTYRVFSAESGLEGISLIARRRPDMIILDLRMPGMDGFTVLRELRENPETANIPVLVVTGELDLKSDEQAQLNNVRVLHKTDISEDEFEAFIADVKRQLKNQKD